MKYLITKSASLSFRVASKETDRKLHCLFLQSILVIRGVGRPCLCVETFEKGCAPSMLSLQAPVLADRDDKVLFLANPNTPDILGYSVGYNPRHDWRRRLVCLGIRPRGFRVFDWTIRLCFGARLLMRLLVFWLLNCQSLSQYIKERNRREYGQDRKPITR